MNIIGIAGTNGSGKDTLGHILADKHGYLFVSVSDLLRDECRTRNVPVDREHLRAISSEWRKDGGLGVLIDKAVAKFKAQNQEYAGLAIASLRNPGEADRVHELEGKVIWVDADPKIRYERIQAVNRGRGGEDIKTFEEFLAEEAAEMSTTGDETTLNMGVVKQRADEFMQNEQTADELAEHVDRFLATL